MRLELLLRDLRCLLPTARLVFRDTEIRELRRCL